MLKDEVASKVRRILHKLYLSALFLCLGTATLFLGFYFVATVHDNSVTEQDIACLVSKEKQEKDFWAKLPDAKVVEEDDKQRQTIDLVKYSRELADRSGCAVAYDSIQHGFYSTRAWVDGHKETKYWERCAEFLKSALALVVLSVLMFALSRWLKWLLS